LLVVKEPGNSVCCQLPLGTCRLLRSVVFVSSRERDYAVFHGLRQLFFALSPQFSIHIAGWRPDASEHKRSMAKQYEFFKSRSERTPLYRFEVGLRTFETE
jgi:hypothetical protein